MCRIQVKNPTTEASKVKKIVAIKLLLFCHQIGDYYLMIIHFDNSSFDSTHTYGRKYFRIKK